MSLSKLGVSVLIALKKEKEKKKTKNLRERHQQYQFSETRCLESSQIGDGFSKLTNYLPSTTPFPASKISNLTSPGVDSDRTSRSSLALRHRKPQSQTDSSNGVVATHSAPNTVKVQPGPRMSRRYCRIDTPMAAILQRTTAGQCR